MNELPTNRASKIQPRDDEYIEEVKRRALEIEAKLKKRVAEEGIPCPVCGYRTKK